MPSAATTKRPTAGRTRSKEWAESGLVNIVGGCCGTSPDHIAAIAAGVSTVARAPVPQIEPKLRLSGLEPFNVGDRNRCSSTLASAPTSPARKPSPSMILEGRFDDALAVARQQVENGAQVIDINMDEAMLDSTRRWIASSS
jgi:5-methyltetrahydrofolate--homocysteine methyltransferase